MMKKKLSKVARRRRVIVFVVELVVTAVVMLGVIYVLGWAVARAQGPMIALLDNAAKAVIG